MKGGEWVVFRKESIEQRLGKIEEALAVLKRHRAISRDAFLGNIETRWIVERGLILVSECVFDIGTHILAGVFGTYPEQYKEVILNCEEKEVISKETGWRLRGLAGFRNVLVHGYLQLDPNRVYDSLQEDLPVFRDFIRDVLRWLSAEREPPGPEETPQ
ncbi:MAG: DUF86 domain-containing protein [Armatimonadetes bacterium]|nr:DUF86 domain-containing protein [Armatimonadota bacterium]